MANQYRDFAPLSITEDILHGDTELENWLCEHPGADINRLSVGGWGHPILIWTSDGIITPAKVDIARFLLARGADPAAPADKVALIEPGDPARKTTYGALQVQADAVARGLLSSVAALAQRSHDSRVPRSRNPKNAFTPKTKTEHSFPKKKLSLEASRQGRPAAHT